MALPADMKIGRFLEWYTELPFSDRPRKSQTFLIQNIECYIFFCKDASGYYNVYLKPITSNLSLVSLSLIIYCDYSGNGYYSRSLVKFMEPNKCIYNIHWTSLPATMNYNQGYFARFCILFLNGDILSLEKKTGEKSTQADLILPLQTEKSTQADLMLTLQADMEYLSLDFSELLKSGDHSDVQLLCNGGKIPAHRAVLAARSKAFSDMFRDTTEESKTGFINLTTTDKSIMELCLEFIYKGKILNLPAEKASNLYVLGQVLKIPSLTKMCADLMIRSLSEDNYIPSLVLADKYSDDYFRSCVVDYISDHVELLKTENWVKFSEEYMKTANDVYRKCIVKLI